MEYFYDYAYENWGEDNNIVQDLSNALVDYYTVNPPENNNSDVTGQSGSATGSVSGKSSTTLNGKTMDGAKQINTNWCTYTVAEVLAKYFGKGFNQVDYATMYNGGLLNMQDAAIFASFFDTYFDINMGHGMDGMPPSARALIAALNDGYPLVFVANGAANSTIDHAMMIASYDSSTGMFQVFDPATGLFTDTSYNDLQKMYKDPNSPHMYTVTGQK